MATVSPAHQRQPVIWCWLLLLWLAAASAQVAANPATTPANKFQWYQQDWAIMGTTVGARIWWSDPHQAQQLLALVRKEMERIDATYSPYKATSELSLINQNAAQKAQTLNAEFAQLIDKAQWVNRISHGAFDISYASVGHLYDYRAGTAPNADTLGQHLAAVGNFQWHAPTRQLKFNHPSVQLDLGGLAKGYAVEQAVALLRENGVRHASVNAGGDTRLLGDNLGKPWLIGIKNPRPANADEQWQSVIKLPLIDEAISTSGDYERYFIDDANGERIHHIINPKTGQSSHGVVSATVIGPSGSNTDPLSTAVFVMGAEAGLAMINALADYEAIVITSQGQVRYSAGLISPQNK